VHAGARPAKRESRADGAVSQNSAVRIASSSTLF